jgi:hypothetical protein
MNWLTCTRFITSTSERNGGRPACQCSTQFSVQRLPHVLVHGTPLASLPWDLGADQFIFLPRPTVYCQTTMT